MHGIVCVMGHFFGFFKILFFMRFFILGVSPSIYSIVVIWNCRGWSLSKSLSSIVWSLSSYVVPSFSKLSSLSDPFFLMRFFVLRVSPSINSVVIIRYSRHWSLHKSIVSTLSLFLSFSFPFRWMQLFILGICPSIHSIVIIRNVRGRHLWKSVKVIMWMWRMVSMMISKLSKSWASNWISKNCLSVSIGVSFQPWCFIDKSWFVNMSPCVTVLTVPVGRKFRVHFYGFTKWKWA